MPSLADYEAVKNRYLELSEQARQGDVRSYTELVRLEGEKVLAAQEHIRSLVTRKAELEQARAASHRTRERFLTAGFLMQQTGFVLALIASVVGRPAEQKQDPTPTAPPARKPGGRKR